MAIRILITHLPTGQNFEEIWEFILLAVSAEKKLGLNFKRIARATGGFKTPKIQLSWNTTSLETKYPELSLSEENGFWQIRNVH